MPIKEMIAKVNAKLQGHYNYYGITDNSRMTGAYFNNAKYIIFKWINRRGQRNSYTWQGFYEMLKYYPLVKPKVCVNIYEK